MGVRDITYDEFVNRYCGDTKPTTYQGIAIRHFLDELRDGVWIRGRGAGKTTVRRWLIQYLIELEREESDNWNNWVLTELEPGLDLPIDEAPYGRDLDGKPITAEEHVDLILAAKNAPLDPPAFGSTREAGRRNSGRIDL